MSGENSLLLFLMINVLAILIRVPAPSIKLRYDECNSVEILITRVVSWCDSESKFYQYLFINSPVMFGHFDCLFMGNIDLILFSYFS